MPRPPRFSYPQALHHVTLRCNNREFLLEQPWLAEFGRLLQECRTRFSVRLYNYCLMTNHVHLVFEVGQANTLPTMMHWLSTSFVRRFNRTTGRRGHLWEGRYRSTLVEQSSYFYRCMAYVDLNPVRAGLVGDCADYPWCGHPALRAEDTTVLDIHPLYLDLGADAGSRYAWYRGMLADEARRPAVSLARAYFVGTRRFAQRMEARFGLEASGRQVDRRDLGSGVLCVAPRQGHPWPQV